MNYSVVKIFNEKLNNNIELFEFGSGFSTHYFASKKKAVTSLENNENWFNKLKQEVPNNVTLILEKNINNGDYAKTIKLTKKLFDLIVVDGRDRINCFEQSVPSLSKTGVIVLDDSSREKYAKAFEIANKHGFRYLSIGGLKPCSNLTNTTTIFYRDNNCLGL